MSSEPSPRLAVLLDQLRAARTYTDHLLAGTDPAEWFVVPTAGVSHVGWQVGHLAMSDYRLLIERVRGVRAGDDEIFPRAWMGLFGAGSTPRPGASGYPPAAEISAAYDRARAAAMAELAGLTDADLAGPIHAPHGLFDDVCGALGWCARHEMLHAGQIGLLRRQLGRPPQW